MFLVDGVECGEVRHVGEEAGRFDNVFKSASGGFQHRRDVAADNLGLFGNIAGAHRAGRGIKRELSGAIQCVAGEYRLRIWADGLGGRQE